jgi:outer membrane protein
MALFYGFRGIESIAIGFYELVSSDDHLAEMQHPQDNGLILLSMRIRLLALMALLAFPLGAVEQFTLVEAVRRAVARNPGLQAADAQVERARRERSEVQASRFPRFEAGSSFTRGDSPVYAFGSLLDQRNFGQANFDIGTLNHPGYVTNFKSYLQVGVPLFTGFEIQSAQKMAELGLSQAESAATGARQDMRLGVLEAGLQTLQAQELRNMLDERIRASQEEIQSAERLRAKGLVLGSDFFAAQAVLSGLQAWRVQADKMAEAGRDSLAILVGLSPAGFQLRGTLRAGGPALPSENELRGMARQNRSDLRSARLQVQQSEVALFQEKSTILPRVDAMAQAETNTENFSSNPSSRLLMVRARWALGDPAYTARRKKAAAAFRAGRQQQEALEEKVQIEILQALRRYEGARDALPLLEGTAEQARKSLDLFRPLYREGRQSILDVLRAEEALARAESLRLETLAQLHIQRAKTLAAAGILDEGALGALSAALEKPR